MTVVWVVLNAAGDKFNAAVVDARRREGGLARHETNAALGDMVRRFDHESALMTVL
jgi:hypothetical protein